VVLLHERPVSGTTQRLKDADDFVPSIAVQNFVSWAWDSRFFFADEQNTV
jgi:hypothetical protein